jgi:hypothetical protein
VRSGHSGGPTLRKKSARSRSALRRPITVRDAATWAYAGNGWLSTNPGGGCEYPLFLTLSTSVQALLGAGALALRLGPYRATQPPQTGNTWPTKQAAALLHK